MHKHEINLFMLGNIWISLGLRWGEGESGCSMFSPHLVHNFWKPSSDVIKNSTKVAINKRQKQSYRNIFSLTSVTLSNFNDQKFQAFTENLENSTIFKRQFTD